MSLQPDIDLTRLIADLQARSIVHHHILMQLVQRDAAASGDARKYLSLLTDDLTRIADESLPLNDMRAAAMSLRDYLDDFLVRVAVEA